ncbi:MAG: DNA methyltransferase [Candidatus Hodarchaeota archaeon]
MTNSSEIDNSWVNDRTEQSMIQFQGDIDPKIELPHKSEILVISRDQSFLTHGIHKFPAKFFPELPRYLIKHYTTKGDLVLDPMCGSGTVVLESLLCERASIGIDIDPIARMIAEVKTNPLQPHLLKDVETQLVKDMKNLTENRRFHPLIPEFNYRDTWFKEFVLRELGIIKHSIDTLPDSGFPLSTLHDVNGVLKFLKVVFSSIIRDVSNADPHCTRTVIRKNLQKRIAPGDTIAQFKHALSKQISNMSQFHSVYSSLEPTSLEIINASASDTGLLSDSVDLAVTSPPYINAVDYPRTHQLEMYWLGLVEDGPLSNMKRRYIGTETVYKSEYASLRTTGLSSLDPLLSKIYDRDPRRSYIVYKFFDDMKKQLIETYRVLRPGALYCVAIGNNVIRGHKVKSHEILTEIATSDEVGFMLEKSFFSGVIRHFIKIPRKERMAGEWILILKKP